MLSAVHTHIRDKTKKGWEGKQAHRSEVIYPRSYNRLVAELGIAPTSPDFQSRAPDWATLKMFMFIMRPSAFQDQGSLVSRGLFWKL